MNEPEVTFDVRELLPYLAGTALVTTLALVLILRFTSVVSLGGAPSVVTFDVVKYTNSQRAVASAFINPRADIARANELLLKLPERTREVIEEVAGPGTLVMVKQGVVQGQAEDITDKVLTKLGLPVDVPTKDEPQAALDELPTNLDRSIGRLPSPKAPSTQLEGSTNSEVLP